MHYIKPDLKTKHVCVCVFYACWVWRKQILFQPVHFYNQFGNVEKMTWFLLLFQHSTHLFESVLCQRSCFPVVLCWSSWHACLHSCTFPTSMGVSADNHMCVLAERGTPSVLFSTSTSVQAHETLLCSVSVSLCKHVLAMPAVTLDLTQTQSSMRKSLTAALDYINYHGQKRHTHSSHWLQP